MVSCYSLHFAFKPYVKFDPVKCVSPLRLLTEASKQLVIVNYSYPAIEGTTAVFSCSRSGYELNGPQSATCTRNGEWVPDPKQAQCEGIIKFYSQHYDIVMFRCVIL
jgi:hypothetical protein